jgi:lipid-binding SYLF domain-containing protein
MKQMIRFVCAALMMSVSAIAMADTPTAAECQETLAKFKDLGNTNELLAGAHAYAILPTIGKAGFIVGGAAGSGCVYEMGKQTGTTSMKQATIGLQLGGQAYSQLILFQNKETYGKFNDGEFEFGADATAVALTYGAAAGATTKGSSASAGDTKGTASWKRGMAVFTLAKGGLMYEASIGGQKFKFEALE